MSAISWAFDAVLATALVGAGALAWRLDRRLSALRSGQDGVRDAVVQLSEATIRAEASVRALKATGEAIGAELEAEIIRGQRLAEELRRLNAPGAKRSMSTAQKTDPAAEVAPSLRDLIDALKTTR